MLIHAVEGGFHLGDSEAQIDGAAPAEQIVSGNVLRVLRSAWGQRIN